MIETTIFASPHRRIQALILFFQTVIFGSFIYGLAIGAPSVIVNAVIALGVTFIPALLQRDWKLRLSPSVTLWLTLGVTLHTIGMLGLYDFINWWDTLTHFTSGMLVAGTAYTIIIAFDNQTSKLYFPPLFVNAFVLITTLAFGVSWEILEFIGRTLADALGFDPILVQYGLSDSITDLIVDALSGVIIIIVGPHTLSSLIQTIDSWLEEHFQEKIKQM
ncbi:MAG: hypothetical protein ABEI86_00525 [Halobacteriaceae archaeon]